MLIAKRSLGAQLAVTASLPQRFDLALALAVQEGGRSADGTCYGGTDTDATEDESMLLRSAKSRAISAYEISSLIAETFPPDLLLSVCSSLSGAQAVDHTGSADLHIVLDSSFTVSANDTLL